MQNQPNGVVKVLFKPYDQTKKIRKLFYNSIIRKSTRNKENLHICKPLTMSTL